jgi:hypothetical protein
MQEGVESAVWSVDAMHRTGATTGRGCWFEAVNVKETADYHQHLLIFLVSSGTAEPQQ